MTRADRLMVVAAVLAAMLVAPSRASADPNIGVPVTPTGALGPPVEIDECQLLYSGNDVAGESAGVTMKFTNDSKLTADLINFHVSAGDESGNIRDVGTFSPGIEITHHYKEGSGHMMFAPLLSHVHLDCSVASVHFTNGSVWQASAVPAATPALVAMGSTHLALVSAPAALTFDGMGKEFDQFVSVYSAAGLRSFHQSGTCSGIVRVRTVDTGSRSVALRVSPLSKGRCTITIDDAASRSLDIPVIVGETP
jgi:hypothetical protein